MEINWSKLWDINRPFPETGWFVRAFAHRIMMMTGLVRYLVTDGWSDTHILIAPWFMFMTAAKLMAVDCCCTWDS